MSAESPREAGLRRTSVTGNTIAGTIGVGYGAAKLRDTHVKQYPGVLNRHVAAGTAHRIVAGKDPAKVAHAVKVITTGHPGFKSMVVAGTAGGVAAGARRLNAHLDVRARRKVVAPAPVRTKVGKRVLTESEKRNAELSRHHRVKTDGKALGYDTSALRVHSRDIPNTPAPPHPGFRARWGAARHPPRVKHEKVQSSAINSMGYQRQTRRLSVEFHSRPGEPYQWRVPREVGAKVMHAPSKGKAYSTEIRGKYKTPTRYTVGDRARLFADPHQVSKAKHPRADQVGAGTVGAGAAQGAYQKAGYSTKHYVDRHTRKGNPGVTAEQVKAQDKALKPLKSKYGMRLPKGDPARDNVGYHRAYPLELPHASTIRALGHTHEGRLGVGVGAATTVLGGAAALGAAHHHLNKSVSAFGIQH